MPSDLGERTSSFAGDAGRRDPINLISRGTATTTFARTRPATLIAARVREFGLVGFARADDDASRPSDRRSCE